MPRLKRLADILALSSQTCSAKKKQKKYAKYVVVSEKCIIFTTTYRLIFASLHEYFSYPYDSFYTHTSLDRADVKDRIQHWLEDEANAVPDFTFEAEDHITLYYACGQIQRISIDLKCYQ